MAQPRWNPVSVNFGGSNQALANAQRGFSGFTSGVGAIQDRLAAEQREKNRLAQQVVTNQRAESLLGIQQAQEGRAADTYATKVASDKALAAALAGVVKTKPTAGIEAVKGNKAEREAIIARNAALTAKQEVLDSEITKKGEDYAIAFDKFNNPVQVPVAPREVSQQHKQRSNALRNMINNVHSGKPYEIDATGQRMLNQLTVPNAVSTVGQFLGDASNNLFGTSFGKKDKQGVRDELNPVAPDRVGTGVTPLSPEAVKAAEVRSDEAHQKALAESGLGELSNRLNNVGKVETVPDLIKEVKAVKAGTADIPLADQEKALRAAIMGNNNISGTAKLDALSKMDEVFPKSKGPTISEQLAMAKYKAGVIGDAKTVSGYREIFPKMPRGISTVDAAKAWATKQSKKASGNGKFSVATELYSGLTSTDAEDVDAVDKFLVTNESTINKMNTSDKKKFVARAKARYAQQGYWDLGDILSLSTAAGTALAP